MLENTTEITPKPRLTELWPLIALLIIALDLSGLYVALGRREYLLNPVWIYFAFYTVAFGLYAYACARLVPKIPRKWQHISLVIILLFSVIFRASVAPARPSLSTDMYRYVWDGRLSSHLINPYRWTPNASNLRSLRDENWEPMEYKGYQTIYMPTSQVVFWACYQAFGNWLQGFKAVYAVFDFGVIGLIALILRKFGRPSTEIIWYAWCPLPITEIALAGHQDIVGVFFLMLTFLLVMNPRTRSVAALTLVVAGLTKGFALILIPMFVRAYGWRFAVIAGLALIYLGMPMWVCLPQFLHGMAQYLQYVHVNSGFFAELNLSLAPITSNHYFVASKICNVIILAAIAWSVWRPVRGTLDLMRRTLIVLIITLLVVPTLFPWYLVWVLPFLSLVGRRPLYSLVLFSSLVSLLYTYYIHMLPLRWVIFVEYLPVYLVAGWEYHRWRRLQSTPIEPTRPDPRAIAPISQPTLES